MSVINNVLKDLETRESGFAPIEFPALENRVERRPAWKPLILVSLVMASVIAAAWYYRQSGLPFDPPRWWQAVSEPSASEQTAVAGVELTPAGIEPETAGRLQATSVAETNSPPPGAEAPAGEPANDADAATGIPGESPPPNQIVGLQMHEADAEMHLEFALREKVIAYVTERSENVFAYHLRDIESRIVAPVLRDNRWLQSLSIAAVEDGVDIRFSTLAGILVETRQQEAGDEHIWRISFRQPEPVALAQPLEQNPPAAVMAVDPVKETLVVAAEPVEETPVTETAAVAEPTTTLEDTPPKAAPAVPGESGTAVPEPPAEPNTTPQEPNEVKVDIRATSLHANDVNRLRYALDLIGSGRHAEAERLLQSLLLSSEDRAARAHLLALYGHQNRHDRLARLAQNSLARYPGDSVFLTEYARSRYQAKAYRVALELLSGIPRFNADQHALAAACHQRLENHERAIEHYQQALALNAGNARNWVGLGISQEHTADLEKALQSYRNAMKLGTLNERLLIFVEKRSATLAQVLK